jgi:hypothetical protein
MHRPARQVIFGVVERLTVVEGQRDVRGRLRENVPELRTRLWERGAIRPELALPPACNEGRNQAAIRPQLDRNQSRESSHSHLGHICSTLAFAPPS